MLLMPIAAYVRPVNMRMAAVARHFGECQTLAYNAPFREKLRAAREHRSVIASMPPFRNFWLLFVPGLSVTLDWRDGWSIAMATGYGGNRKLRPLRAIAVKTVEIIAIMLAKEVWTCTPGLFRHHCKRLPRFLRRKIRLVPNGHQMEVTAERFTEFIPGERLTAVCAGKFAAYGVQEVLRILDTLAQRYPGRAIDIRVIGAPDEDRGAILDHIRDMSITVSWEGRKPYDEIVKDLAAADLAVAVIRDQSYDFGTKIFDYIAAGTPIVDVFTDPDFRAYFSGCFDTDYDPEIARRKAERFHRGEQMTRALGRAHPAIRKPAAEAVTATA